MVLKNSIKLTIATFIVAAIIFGTARADIGNNIFTQGTSPQGEISSAVNPLNPLNSAVVFSEYGTGQMDAFYKAFYTTDGGLTWNESKIDIHPAKPLCYEVSRVSPSVYFDSKGICKLTRVETWLRFLSPTTPDSLFNDVDLAESTDGGATWKAPTNQTLTEFTAKGAYSSSGIHMTEFNTACKSLIDLSTGKFFGREYVIVSRVGTLESGSRRYLTLDYRDKDSAEFSGKHFTLSDTSFFDASYVSPFIDRTGRLCAIYFAQKTAEKGVYFSASSDGGEKFSKPVKIADIIGISDTNYTPAYFNNADLSPSISTIYDSTNGKITVFWNSVDPESDSSMRVFRSYSTDGGVSWSAVDPVTPKPASGRRDCFFPTAGLNSAGTYFIGFYDRLQDNANESAYYSCMMSYDGGASFSEPIQISSASTDFATVGTGNKQGITSGNTVIPSNEGFTALWIDGRNGDGNTAAASAFVPDHFSAVTDNINSPANGIGIEVFPVPAVSEVSYKLTNIRQASACVYNSFGCKVPRSVSTDEFSGSFNTDGLSAGVYYLSITAKDGRQIVRKFEKVN